MSHPSHSAIYRLEAIEVPTALQSKLIRVAEDNECGQLILLIRGSLTLNNERNSPRELQGPALLWQPKASGLSVRIHAGSECCLLTLPNEIVLRVQQLDQDSEGRRLIPNQGLELNLGHYTDLQKVVHQSFLAVVNEVQQNNGPSLTLVFSHLSIIWVNIWRQVGAEDMLRSAEKDVQSVLQRFRELVETHYREHWGVSQYADALRISHDRLYACCKREVGLTPIQVIHERLTEESKLALERSALNMEQIAYTLGFRDSTHFSHFFKRMTEHSPRQYRAMRHQTAGTDLSGNDQNFAHWP